MNPCRGAGRENTGAREDVTVNLATRRSSPQDAACSPGGVKSHVTAGHGGGAKAILPGIARIESIHCFHKTIGGLPGNENKTVGPCQIFKNECRLDMEEAARMAQMDFSVQVAYNGYRKVVGVHAGDIVEAHHSACRQAADAHRYWRLHDGRRRRRPRIAGGHRRIGRPQPRAEN
jgi:nickel-dependent lactate racemase